MSHRREEERGGGWSAVTRSPPLCMFSRCVLRRRRCSERDQACRHRAACNNRRRSESAKCSCPSHSSRPALEELRSKPAPAGYHMYIVPNPQTPSWSSPREVFWLLGGMTPGMTRETTAIANSIASICGCLMCLSIFQLPTISAILGLVVSCKMSCCSSSTSQRVSNAPCTKCTAWIGFGFACLTGFLCLLNGGGWLSSALPALQSYDECTAGQGRGQVTAVHCFGFARRRALSEGHRLASLSEDGLGSIAHDWAGAFALFMAKRGMSDADNNTSTAIATAALTPPSSALIPSSKAKANVGYARRKLSHANTVTPGCPSSRPCGTGRACFLYTCVYSWHSHSTYSSSIGICQDSSTCATCDDSCDHASDGDCDDGGPGSRYEWCSPGADCSDCGQRTVDEVSDTPGSGTGLSVWSSSPPPSPRPPLDPATPASSAPPTSLSASLTNAWTRAQTWSNFLSQRRAISAAVASM